MMGDEWGMGGVGVRWMDLCVYGEKGVWKDEVGWVGRTVNMS